MLSPHEQPLSPAVPPSEETFRTESFKNQFKNLGLVLIEGGFVVYSGVMAVETGISVMETYEATTAVHQLENQQPAILRNGTSLSSQLDSLHTGSASSNGPSQYDAQPTAPTVNLDEFRHALAWTEKHETAQAAVTDNLEASWDSGENAAAAGGAIALLHMGQRRYKRKQKALKQAHKQEGAQ
jgi:hypothetical protein